MFMYLKLIYVEIIVRALSHYNTKNPAHLKEIIIIVGIRISFIAIIIDIEQHAQLHTDDVLVLQHKHKQNKP